MEKPRKKELKNNTGDSDTYLAGKAAGYNDACEEWEKYHNFMTSKENFPTKEDLQKIIRDDIHSIIAEVISRHKGVR